MGMGIELREAMEIYPFSQANLVAGHGGLSRKVVSANIQEVPFVDQWLKGGEILFTAGYAFRSAQKGCEMMERLNKVGIAALAVKPGQYLQDIPEEMIDCANRLSLPLLELPVGLPYMDCIIAIFERITQKQLLVMRRVERVHAMLTETILNKKGLSGICAILNRVTGNSVFIASPLGSLLAWRTGKDDLPGEKEYTGEMRSLFEEYFSRAEKAPLKQNQCNIISPQSGVSLVVVPIFVQDEHLAYLVLDTAQNPMMDVDMVAFEQACSMVAVELLNEQAMWQREQKIREQLLEDLLMQRYADEDMVVQRGRHLGIDLSGKYCIFVVDADAFEELLRSGILGTDEGKIQRIKSAVRQIIRKAASQFKRPCLVLDSSVGAVCMIEVRKESDMQELVCLIDSLLAELEKLNTSLRFSAGICRIKQGIRNVDEAHKEAILAMRAGRGLFGGTGGRTHNFAQLGCLCFLCELSSSAAMQDFYEENMRVLLNYDKENNAELVKTLECFFVCGQNLRQTSEMLFVHKNSVIYRLAKIEALLGKKLSQHQNSFDLQLCLKLRGIYSK